MSIISRLVNKSFSATFENDDGVREANSLFSTLFEEDEGSTLTAKDIYTRLTKNSACSIARRRTT